MLACLVDIVRILGGLKREIIVRRFSPPRILTTKPLPVSTHTHTYTHTHTHTSRGPWSGGWVGVGVCV